MGNILLALVPAVMWGIQPLILQTIGGKTSNQQMGMSLGALIFSIGVLFFHQPVWSWHLILASFVCGLAWAFGQITQIESFHIIGVSAAMPISTGMQLIGVTLFGIFYFHEWTSTMDYVYGISALIVIILGVFFTAYREKGDNSGKQGVMQRGLFVLVLSTIGQVTYNVIPRMADLNGWDVLFPQGIGMAIGAMAFSFFFDKKPELFSKKSFQNIAAGAAFAIGNIGILLSNKVNGVAVGFTLSQMNVIVNTLGGLILLKESRTSKELKLTIGGLILVAAGGILIGLTK